MKIPLTLLAWIGNLANAAKSYDPGEMLETNYKVEKIVHGFEQHPANKNEFFDWFSEETKKGFTPKQFEAFRNNYEYRTAGTLISVMQTALHLAKRGDYEHLPYVSQNAREEGGGLSVDGSKDPAHMGLCEKAFNMLGERVFRIPPIDIPDIDPNTLLPEARQFRESQEKSFEDKGNKLIGRYLAHEKAAPDMLYVIEDLFKAYKGYFSEEEYKEMTQYFRAHIPESREEKSGVEDRHGKDALLVAASAMYRNLEAQKQIIEGGQEMLDAQEALWQAMKGYMTEIGNENERVRPERVKLTPGITAKDDQALTPKPNAQFPKTCGSLSYLNLSTSKGNGRG